MAGRTVVPTEPRGLEDGPLPQGPVKHLPAHLKLYFPGTQAEQLLLQRVQIGSQIQETIKNGSTMG